MLHLAMYLLSFFLLLLVAYLELIALLYSTLNLLSSSSSVEELGDCSLVYEYKLLEPKGWSPYPQVTLLGFKAMPSSVLNYLG